MGAGITIRVVGVGDAETLREFRLRALRDAPTAFLTTAADAAARPESFWEEHAERSAVGEGWRIFFAERAGEPVGMATVSVEAGGSVAELFQMWVDPLSRGQGVGSLLIDAALEWCRGRVARLRLGVAGDNVAATRLYASRGFHPTGEEESFGRRDGIVVRYLERGVDDR